MQTCAICGEPFTDSHYVKHQASWVLRNQVKALRMFRFLNTPQQERDLAEAEAELRRRAREAREGLAEHRREMDEASARVHRARREAGK